MIKIQVEWFIEGKNREGRTCRSPSLNQGWFKEEMLVDCSLVNFDVFITNVLIALKRRFAGFSLDWAWDWTGYVMYPHEEAARFVLSSRIGATIRELRTTDDPQEIFLVADFASQSQIPRRIDPEDDDTS